MDDLSEVIKDEKEEGLVKPGRLVFDDFFVFRTKLGRLVKDMVFEPNKRLLISVQRNLGKSTSRQIEYLIDVTTEDKIHFFDLNSVPTGMAIPASPDYPDVEKEEDPTKI